MPSAPTTIAAPAIAALPGVDHALHRLADQNYWTYQLGQPIAAEPAAIAAIALAAQGRRHDAQQPASWLAQIQQRDGSVGISANEALPCWPTALALLAWKTLDDAGSQATANFERPVRRAVKWALKNRGRTAPQTAHMGHDTTLVGWSWAADTHCWLEPTCYFVLALKAAGYADHPRTREGVRLIVDRLLPSGGANYGNTFVLGQQLLPHMQPTGLAMMALADEPLDDPRIEKSLAWLAAIVSPESPAVSLSFALLGLAAWRQQPTAAEEWLACRLTSGDAKSLSPYKQALLLWAAKGLHD